MNQMLLAHFNMVHKEKFFQFSFQPQVTNYDDLFAVLDEFKKEIEVMKDKQEAEEAKAKQEAGDAPQEEAPAEQQETIS